MDGHQSDDDHEFLFKNLNEESPPELFVIIIPRANSRLLEDSEDTDDTNTSSENSPSQVSFIFIWFSCFCIEFFKNNLPPLGKILFCNP